ncbi:acyl-CoA dehydrogenase family protein [Pseudonocardia sp. GCM10023141]|uniref:acyl-CoA dehydrogenase family protein n=1 Tax=Pseudonocardia sp. GCM10023141 TaxID=3252653 RepID=UPI00361F6410
MDFEIVDELEAHRNAARAWLDRYFEPRWAAEQKKTGSYHTPELHALLAEQGWYGAGWPAEYGGTERDPDLARALLQELARVGVRHDGWSTTSLVLNTLLTVGTDEQKRAYIPAGLRGEVVIALGYTEPDSGSDVAAAKTRVVRDGAGWRVTGQKMFTSTADHATHVFLLGRTDLDVAKHRGLTMFLVSTDSPGFECHLVATLGGQRTTATFYNDVAVPDSARIGAVDGGWAVMKVALVHERGGGSVGARPPSNTSGSIGDPKTTLPLKVAAWARSTRRPDGTLVWDDPTVAERLANMAVENEIAKLLWMRPAWVARTGELPTTEGSAAKLYSTEVAQRHQSDMLDIIGAEAVMHRDAEGAPLGAAVEEAFRYSVVGTIYGGSSEIMREIIAERQLGLPRVRDGKPGV